MKTVTASLFQKNFGQFKELAQREPVAITSNGRESVVLISASEYAALSKLRFAYGAEVNEDFEQDLAEHFDAHREVHDGLSK